MQWTKEESAFDVATYFSNGHSIITTRAFRKEFKNAHACCVPDRYSIVQWVGTILDRNSV